MYVPPDRKTQGLILGQSIRRNVAFPQLGQLGRWGLTNAVAEERLVDAAAARMSLRYRSSGQAVQELSGGNQQKVLLASRIYADPDVLVIQEPTRGVDVAARDEIHTLLRQLAEERRCIVFASSDVEEAVDLSTRLLVFRDGAVRATLVGAAKTQANALEAAGKSERDL
jgi:ABC-type sugar transport system ATPase subunit